MFCPNKIVSYQSPVRNNFVLINLNLFFNFFIFNKKKQPSEPLEDFAGYDYPKPAIPFPLPTTDSDAENLPSRAGGAPGRLING